MKGDFTRDTFDKRKHYASVRQQQGRVQLDADSNEQADIHLYQRRTHALDVIGQSGAPLNDAGFEITPLDDGSDLLIGAGRMYVDGILCEMESHEPVEITSSVTSGTTSIIVRSLESADGRAFEVGAVVAVEEDGAGTPFYTTLSAIDEGTLTLTLNDAVSSSLATPTVRPVTTYRFQPDYNAEVSPPADIFAAEKFYVAYLDVWDQLVTPIDDGRIRETALGGPDTAFRAQTLSQVKLLELESDPGDCAEALAQLNAAITPQSGQLAARAEETPQSDDPCIVSPTAGYRSLRNHLYRVEVHEPGLAGAATFKWSRVNGSVLYEWTSQDNEVLTVSDPRGALADEITAGDWIEVTCDERERRSEPGIMVQVESVEGDTLTVDLTTLDDPSGGSTLDIADFTGTPRVRRWDMSGGVITIPSSGGGWLDLEDGVQIHFTSGYYRTGKHWLIPARTGEGDVEWPTVTGASGEEPVSVDPVGPTHHYAVLARFETDASAVPVGASFHDCRSLFPSLTQQRSLFYVGGDGQVGVPGQMLARALIVGVSDGQNPVQGAKVTFSVEGGQSDSEISIDGSVWTGVLSEQETGADGTVKVFWKMPTVTPIGTVQARIVDDNGETVHLPIRFGASFGAGSEDGVVKIAEIRTGPFVPDGEGGDAAPNFVNDGVVALGNEADFVLRFVLKSPIKRFSVYPNRPAVSVSVDVPWPLTSDDTLEWELEPGVAVDRMNWDTTYGGPTVTTRFPLSYQSMELSMGVDTNLLLYPEEFKTEEGFGGYSQFWLVPFHDNAVKWLLEVLKRCANKFDIHRLRVRVHIDGNFIWNEESGSPHRYLDGNAFGFLADDGRIDIKLDRVGDGVPGGALDLWFWVKTNLPQVLDDQLTTAPDVWVVVDDDSVQSVSDTTRQVVYPSEIDFGGSTVSSVSIVDLGATPVGASGPTYYIRLFNKGVSSPLHGSVGDLRGVVSVEGGNFTINPSAGDVRSQFLVDSTAFVNVPLVFTPGEEGVLYGRLVVATNNPDRPIISVLLKGQGLPAPSIKLEDPADGDNTLDFGTVPAGNTVVRSFVIKNEGQGAMTVGQPGGPHITIAPSNEFTLVNLPSMPLSLPAGQQMLIDVQFNAPSPAQTTGYAAQVTVHSDDPQNPEAHIDVSATVSGSQ